MAWLAPGARLVRISGSSTPLNDGGTQLDNSPIIRLAALVNANEVAGGSVALYWKSTFTVDFGTTPRYVRFGVGSLALATGTPSVPSLSTTDVEFPMDQPTPYPADDEIRVTSLGSISIYSPVTVFYLTRESHPTAGVGTDVTVYGVQIG
jgi:hypothetical protein